MNDATPLRDPSKPEDLYNYRICGESTKRGTPCGARRQRIDGESMPCTNHLPDELRRKFSQSHRSRMEERESWERAQEERRATLWLTGGRELRTGFVSQIRSAGYTGIESRSFTLIGLKTARFGTSAAEKRDMLSGIPDDHRFIVVWIGQWQSDAFLTDAAELRTLQS